MNMNKRHKLKKQAEEKLLKYLNENKEININSINTADNEQGGYKETRMD